MARRFFMEGVVLGRCRVKLRRARPLCVGVEFCDSDIEVLFGEVCLGFVRNIRALFRVVVE
jgi:hypothetical protein